RPRSTWATGASWTSTAPRSPRSRAATWSSSRSPPPRASSRGRWAPSNGSPVIDDELFRRFFLRGPHCSALCDADLRVRAASNELAELCKVSAAELVGRSLLHALPPAPGEEPQRGAMTISYLSQLGSGERLRVR